MEVDNQSSKIVIIVSLLIGIAITNNYSTLFPWLAAIAFKPFIVKVKNLWCAPAVISLLIIRLKLEIILHNLGNKWRMLHFLISKKEKSRIWIDLFWIVEKITGKLNKCNYWALDPKWALSYISFDHCTLQWHTKWLIFAWFFLLTTENFKKSQENVIKESNKVGVAIFCIHPVGMIH